MRTRFLIHSWRCVISICALSACENSLEPLTEDAELLVFINGFLDTADNTQLIRLNGLRPNILADYRGLDDAIVRTLDLTSGTEEIWKDSTVVLDSGENGTVYIGEFKPQEGHIYDLIVQRPGYEPSKARTAVPAEPDIITEEPVRVLNQLTQGVLIQLTQQVWLNGVHRTPGSLAIKYDVYVPETGLVETFSISPSRDGIDTSNGWNFEANLYRDQQIINFQLNRLTTDPPLGLRRIAVVTSIKSDEWYTQFDPENLTFALGFFGSVGRFDISWMLKADAVEKMGFTDQQHLSQSK